MLNCIIIEDKNGGYGKGYPMLEQTFQAHFNVVLFISIRGCAQTKALKAGRREEGTDERRVRLVHIQIQMSCNAAPKITS